MGTQGYFKTSLPSCSQSFGSNQRFQLGSVQPRLILRPDKGETVCPLIKCESQQPKVWELARPEDTSVCYTPMGKWLGREQKGRRWTL